MASFRLKADPIATLISTGMDGLLNLGDTASAEIDNSTGAWEGIWLEANVAYTVGGALEYEHNYVYLVRQLDTTNDESFATQSIEPIACIPFLCHTTGDARRQSAYVPLPPCQFKIVFENQSGRTLAASGNTLKGMKVTKEIV